MGAGRLRVLLLGTQYPHWGARSGYSGFMRWLDPQRFEPQLMHTPLGSDLFPAWLGRAGEQVRRLARKRGRLAFDLNDLMAEWRGFRYCLRRGVDVVHFLDGEHALFALPSWLRAMGKKTAFVGSFHQPEPILRQLVDPAITASLHRVVTVSPAQNRFFESCPVAAPTKTILHGVDTSFFAPGHRPRKPGQPFIVLTVGKWLRDIDAVVATARLLRAESNVQFHLISPGSDLGDLPANIRVSTGISDEQLCDIYRRASLLFLPLKDSTANNALLEGAACGLPVLSSDLVSVRAYLDGPGVRLVTGNDPEHFAAVIRELRTEPEKLEYMGRAVLERARELSWERVAPEFEAVYESAVRDARGASDEVRR